MILDSNGLIVLEQSGSPGNTGDSCAETSRLATLQKLLGKPVTSNLKAFVTPKGVIRYPGSIWGTSDTSSDQVAPLIAALDKVVGISDLETGNNELITMGCYCSMKRAEGSRIQFMYDLALVGQAILFMLPWRYNDATRGITSSAGSTADYLNFINGLAYARTKNWTISCTLATKLTKPSTALAAVQSYYKPEPNVQWLLDIYTEAMPRIWET